MTYSVDVLIAGGGIQGLPLLDQLVAQGYNAILVSNVPVIPCLDHRAAKQAREEFLSYSRFVTIVRNRIAQQRRTGSTEVSQNYFF